MTTNYNMNYLNNLPLTELFDLAKNKFGLTYATMERHLSIPEGGARYAIKAKNSKYEFGIKILEAKNIDLFIHNKTIQKCIDSFRISNDKKAYLKTLRLKKQ